MQSGINAIYKLVSYVGFGQPETLPYDEGFRRWYWMAHGCFVELKLRYSGVFVDAELFVQLFLKYTNVWERGKTKMVR